MKNLITVAEYPQSQIPERYIRIRDLKKACIICQHWTSRRDLRKNKRYIVELEQEHGRCSLQEECRSCIFQPHDFPLYLTRWIILTSLKHKAKSVPKQQKSRFSTKPKRRKDADGQILTSSNQKTTFLGNMRNFFKVRR